MPTARLKALSGQRRIPTAPRTPCPPDRRLTAPARSPTASRSPLTDRRLAPCAAVPTEPPPRQRAPRPPRSEAASLGPLSCRPAALPRRRPRAGEPPFPAVSRAPVPCRRRLTKSRHSTLRRRAPRRPRPSRSRIAWRWATTRVAAGHARFAGRGRGPHGRGPRQRRARGSCPA
jgi:hypothetical protein